MELKEYLRPLRKWWWLIAAAVLVATLSSFIATRRLPPIFRTRATVMIGSAMQNPNPNGNEFWLTQQLANTYADIAKRDNVRMAVMHELGLAWLPDYSARVVPNTQLIEISVTDTSPDRAKGVADELVQQLIRISPMASGTQDQQRQGFIQGQLNELEAKIRQTQEEITRKQGDLSAVFGARQISDLQVQISGLQTKLATLQSNYAQLLSNTQRGALNSITPIEEAALPVVPVGPNRGATVMLAALIGLLLAVSAAYLLEFLDESLKNPDEVQNALGLSTIGAVPKIEGLAVGNELAVLMGSQSAGAEAYRVLRTNLQFAAVGHELQTLMITSPAPSEGKSTTLANLGAAMAQGGRRVVIVDTDLHRPRVHKLLGLRNNVGITTALLQEHPSVEGLLQETAIPGLYALTAGPLPPNPAELLGSARMKELIALLKEEADIVLFDSPPTVALSDAAVMATLCDGVVLVIDVMETRRDVAKRAVEALRRVNAHIVGVVLNRMPSQGEGYYYYYYYDYYSQDEGKMGSAGRSGRKGRRRSRSRSETQPATPPAATGGN